MIQRIQSMKNKKGFTLVELIVVLVILVILAAIAVPSFTQYIQKAKEQQGDIEARSAMLAAKTVSAEYYGKGIETGGTGENFAGDVASLAELPSTSLTTCTYDYVASTYTTGAKLFSLVYTNGTDTWTYTVDANGVGSMKKT